MIKCVLGLPGSGKSLWAAEMIVAYLDAGRQVATNMALKPWLLKHCIDLSDRRLGDAAFFWRYVPPGGVIIIDESDFYWDSLDFAKHGEAKDALLYFKQHRKRHDTVYLFVQNWKNLWVRILRQCQTFVVCENTLRSRPLQRYLPERFRSFIRTEYASTSFLPNEIVSSNFLTHSEAKLYYNAYDTDGLVGDIERYRWAPEAVVNVEGDQAAVREMDEAAKAMGFVPGAVKAG